MARQNQNIDDKIKAYESGEMSEGEMLELFSELVKSGKVRTLRAYYKRLASLLITCGYLNGKGEILKRF